MSLINDALKRAKAATPTPPPDLQFRPVEPLKPVPPRRGWSWSAVLGLAAILAIVAVLVLLRHDAQPLDVLATATPTVAPVREAAATPPIPPAPIPLPEPKPAVQTPPVVAAVPAVAAPAQTLAPSTRHVPAPVPATTATFTTSPGANAPRVPNPITPAPVSPPAKAVTSPQLVASLTPAPAVAVPNATAQVAAAGDPSASPTGVTNEPPVLPRLQAIVFHPTRPTAIIAGRSLFIGDRFGDQRVTAIAQDSVTLAGGGRTNVLSLP